MYVVDKVRFYYLSRKKSTKIRVNPFRQITTSPMVQREARRRRRADARRSDAR
jgi:hypothetical protein